MLASRIAYFHRASSVQANYLQTTNALLEDRGRPRKRPRGSGNSPELGPQRKDSTVATQGLAHPAHTHPQSDLGHVGPITACGVGSRTASALAPRGWLLGSGGKLPIQKENLRRNEAFVAPLLYAGSRSRSGVVGYAVRMRRTPETGLRQALVVGDEPSFGDLSQ